MFGETRYQRRRRERQRERVRRERRERTRQQIRRQLENYRNEERLNNNNIEEVVADNAPDVRPNNVQGEGEEEDNGDNPTEVENNREASEPIPSPMEMASNFVYMFFASLLPENTQIA